MNSLIKKKLEVVFYRSSAGNEPVREWLKSFSKYNKKKLGESIKAVQFGWPLGMPLVKNINDKISEIRTNLEECNCTARILFCMRKDTIILLHGFIKKTQRTPSQDIKLAEQRKKEIERGYNYE